ncbi:Hypothetical predicted protein [Cloeon dipterum]|uniref:Uncharacterized protein n=1 Tax=Cloeon dipterum TaxID=197152 RepID=A0A8S1CGR6_9INSE|nr:Hypothetical predicted protein [Cloeon dipterum]
MFLRVVVFSSLLAFVVAQDMSLDIYRAPKTNISFQTALKSVFQTLLKLIKAALEPKEQFEFSSYQHENSETPALLNELQGVEQLAPLFAGFPILALLLTAVHTIGNMFTKLIW